MTTSPRGGRTTARGCSTGRTTSPSWCGPAAGTPWACVSRRAGTTATPSPARTSTAGVRRGRRPALLEVDYADGTTQRVTSDTGWSASTGPVVTADLLEGGRYDARRETPGRTSPGFDDGDWLRAGEA
ncbi:alpha-L-rhamnosidase N-terminal domain-containing protein, partial [Streptomyces albogriseolus]|uniref:alpha-L-rhamnosidase N-terminal domain-containing protein n=1 Tax=Streptomyces albogriseolus TaxID=1887 RepID=UPI003F4CD086